MTARVHRVGSVIAATLALVALGWLLGSCASPPDAVVARPAPEVTVKFIPMADPGFLAHDVLCVKTPAVACLDTQAEFH